MAENSPSLNAATPIQYVKGVGENRARELRRLGIETCGDLLHFLPRDYLHFTDEAPVNAMRVGNVATVRGTILQTRLYRRPRARLEALLEDASGTEGGRCVLTWFNPYDLPTRVLPGTRIRATGKVTIFRNRYQITQPKVEFLDGADPQSLVPKAARVEPVYPATQDLPSAAIWRIVKNIIEPLTSQTPEWFTREHLAQRGLMPRGEALRLAHLPRVLKDGLQARRTLAYHEFFVHQAVFALKRHHNRHGHPAVALRTDQVVDRRIRALLPFALTAAQERVIEAIRGDLAAHRPMNRLLQGDVGSGKTVVALYAMLAACATPRDTQAPPSGGLTSGGEGRYHQAALMAPTEILAEQHYMTLVRLLEGKKVRIALLTGSVTGADRRRTLDDIAQGRVGIVVGTHALLSETVRFAALALVVIDEQHKFGVEQRARIRTLPAGADARSIAPHTLVMTATPIPRTLALTAFGDLDVSVIDELPPGRQPIFTRMTPSSTRQDVYEWLAQRVARERDQAYVVVPRVDADSPMEEELELAESAPPSETGGASGRGESADRVDSQSVVAGTSPLTALRNAVELQRELQAGWLAGARVGLIHGRMDREARQHIMERFRQHLIDVLVATTVIEVGVDVPEASVMIVENADRFGLSQLHQLRGRVGRGRRQSYCVLLGDLTTDDGIARLQAMVKHSSGFLIAEEDLKLRGMGQLIGTAQSGRSDIHFPELLLDPVLLPLSRKDAFGVIDADPRLLEPGHKALRQAIQDRFADAIALADVG